MSDHELKELPPARPEAIDRNATNASGASNAIDNVQSNESQPTEQRVSNEPAAGSTTSSAYPDRGEQLSRSHGRLAFCGWSIDIVQLLVAIIILSLTLIALKTQIKEYSSNIVSNQLEEYSALMSFIDDCRARNVGAFLSFDALTQCSRIPDKSSLHIAKRCFQPPCGCHLL